MSSPGTTSAARDALLIAAREELRERGVAALGLRAVARRAGLSHAAPGYFFKDRAGMLTALATAGWNELADRLAVVEAGGAESALSRLGGVYVDFGLANAALYDLMTTSDVLDAQDPGLGLAQQRAIAPLLRATGGDEQAPLDAVMSWSFVHGLVALARQHALPAKEGEVDVLVHQVVARFAQRFQS